MYDVLVIGGGAGGLFLAANLKLNGAKGAILESNEIVGKKLLATGAGQCNITNAEDIFSMYERYNNSGRYVKSALSKYSNKDLMRFFTDNGIELTVREDGKVFPKSFKAVEIRDLLLRKAKENGFELIVGSKVTDIKAEGSGEFEVHCNDRHFLTKHLVIATGGKSYPKLGSTGSLYSIIENLGHRIEKQKPCLGPVYVQDYSFSELSGISLDDIVIYQYRAGKKLNEFKGSLLFTHRNLSGPIIINNSRYFEVNDQLEIQFITRNGLEELLLSNADKNLINILKTAMPSRLAEDLLKKWGSSKTKPLELGKKDKASLLSTICNHKVTISNLSQWDEAMTTCGGVSFKSVSTKTFESRVKNNLFFVGEILDYDAQTGGFSLQAVFSNAKICSQALEERLSNM